MAHGTAIAVELRPLHHALIGRGGMPFGSEGLRELTGLAAASAQRYFTPDAFVRRVTSWTSHPPRTTPRLRVSAVTRENLHDSCVAGQRGLLEIVEIFGATRSCSVRDASEIPLIDTKGGASDALEAPDFTGEPSGIRTLASLIKSQETPS